MAWWWKLLYLIAPNGHLFLGFIQLLFEPHENSPFTFCGKVSHSSAVRCTRKDALCWFRSAGFMWCSLSHILEETSSGCCLFSFPFSHCLLQLFSYLFARGDSRLSSRSTSPSWNQAKAQNQARFSCSRCAMDSVAEGCVCCKLKWSKLMKWGTQHFGQRIAKAVHQMQLASTSNPRPEKKSIFNASLVSGLNLISRIAPLHTELNNLKTRVRLQQL